ncbi:MAG: aspartyl protease family protein [Steroidobacteraceae bacterium]
MSPRAFGWIPVLFAASLSTAGAASRCQLAMTPPLLVAMENLRPVIATNINGVEARFIVDTGSFFDFLSPVAAAEFKLPLNDAPPGYYVSGIGGSFVPKIATAKTFSVAGISGHDAEFLVGNNAFGGDIAGILGQNIFRIADVEFDFANGVLRFVKPQHCGDDVLAYWANTQPIAVVRVDWTSAQRPHLIAKAAVNGRDIHVLFDTGSWRSILSLDAARRAGITPDSPGVVPAGATIGLGSKPVRVWAAPIEKFAIGGETIEHTHLLIGDIGLDNADMLLGSDFFLAHHIYVAYSQDKVYFTYNGGPVFDVSALPPVQADAPVGNTPAAGAPVTSNAPTDAAGFMRRGMADASRGELPQAISDLTQACTLEPADAGCHYQRGLAYWRSSQPQLALADFTAAIQRQPADFDAHLARAQLEMVRQPDTAESDLDAVDRIAPQQADLRLQLARLYGVAGEYAGAVHQYDLWIEYHPDDVNLSYALANRCGSEAEANVDVDRALDDCNTALQLIRKSGIAQESAITISNRGLVYLRQGRLDDALADFHDALELRGQFPLARYALGLVERKKGLTAQGQTDLTAAERLDPKIAGLFASIGLKP